MLSQLLSSSGMPFRHIILLVVMIIFPNAYSVDSEDNISSNLISFRKFYSPLAIDLKGVNIENEDKRKITDTSDVAWDWAMRVMSKKGFTMELQRGGILSIRPCYGEVYYGGYPGLLLVMEGGVPLQDSNEKANKKGTSLRVYFDGGSVRQATVIKVTTVNDLNVAFEEVEKMSCGIELLSEEGMTATSYKVTLSGAIAQNISRQIVKLSAFPKIIDEVIHQGGVWITNVKSSDITKLKFKIECRPEGQLKPEKICGVNLLAVEAGKTSRGIVSASLG